MSFNIERRLMQLKQKRQKQEIDACDPSSKVSRVDQMKTYASYLNQDPYSIQIQTPDTIAGIGTDKIYEEPKKSRNEVPSLRQEL